MIFWTIFAFTLNLWRCFVHGSVVTIYSEPNWRGDKTELNLTIGDSLSTVPHPIQSVQIQNGYVFRVFQDQNDLTNPWAMHYDINADESNLSQLLFKIQSYMVYKEEINQRPDSGWIWMYQEQNYTGIKLAIKSSSDIYEWNAQNISILVGEEVGLTTYTKNGGNGVPIYYESDSIVTKPFKSIRVRLKLYIPTQELIEGHVWLYEKSNFEGDRESISLHSSISHLYFDTFLFHLGSIQIPPGMIVICYETTELLGPKTVWDWNVTDFETLSLGIFSFEVVPSNEWPDESYPTPFVAVIRPWSDLYPRNILPWRLPLGSKSSGFEDSHLWQVQSITIPKSLALIAYQYYSGDSYKIWLNSTVLEENASFSGYKVVREEDILDCLDSDPNPNQVGDGKILINDSTWQLRSFKLLNRTEWRGHEACLERPNMHAHTLIQLTTASPVPLMTSATDDELEQGDAIKNHTSRVPPVETTTSTSLLFVDGQDVGSTSQDVGSTSQDVGSTFVPTTKSVKTSISPKGSQLPTTNPVFKDNFVIQTTSMPSTLQQKQSKSLLEEWYSWIVLAVITTFAVVVVIKHRREDRNKQTPPLLDVQWHDLDLFRLTSQGIQLGDTIASGSSGIISLATFLGKTVAVKMLHPNDTERIQSFIDEIDLWTTFDSPYLVTLLGIAWTQPTDIMAVMEYMNMGDLRTYLSVTNPETFSWQNKLMCLNNIAHGLFYLHTSQQLHRDLKSRNVLLDSVNGTKLCDFGSSKDDAFGATMTAMVGTFRWMAPEMLLFQKYSYPVDMYSFGVVMSELNTHQVPYSDIKTGDGRLMSDESVTRMVLHEGLRPTFSPSCPLWYKSLSLQCMSQDPLERPKISEVLGIIYTKLMTIG